MMVQAMVVERKGGGNNPLRKSTNSSNKSWYNKRRNNGIKVARKGKKPPQWEKEGDSLYQEIVNNPYQQPNQKLTYTQAQELLHKLEKEEEEDSSDTTPKQPEMTQLDQETDTPPPPNEPSYSWGGVSVGPVWKSRLVQAGLSQPTPIQREAFTPITKGENVVVASPTGSGKSLAYLLPLLASSIGNEKRLGMVWIVTPTTELALQLQRVVKTLIGGEEEEEDDDDVMLQVLGSDDETANQNDFPLLSSISKAPMLAGTPRVLQQLVKELDSVVFSSNTNEHQALKSLASAISKNLQTVILDEADRLLQTEAVARHRESRKQQQQSETKTKKPRRIRRLEETLTEQVLGPLLFDRRLQPGRRQLQLICASATVGRTLRRQLMELLQAPSMEKAAVLVTADVRTKKDAVARKSSLLPDTLEHAYRLVLPSGIAADDDPQASTLTALWETLSELEPAPTLIFPGRLGVERVQETLRSKGLEDIRGLASAGDMETKKTSKTDPTFENQTWERTPVYVVGEKLGRGLDLQGVRYVLLLQVPSSAAGYTHLAGRTGRNGAPGTAISFCQPREAPRLVVIAETLGLSFLNLSPSEGTTDEQVSVEESSAKDEKDASTFSWAELSESSLKRKNIAAIIQYLADHGASLNEEDGKKPTKTDLISAVNDLHCANN
jgi:superfamily II DNA/RNA helicase